MDTHAPTTTAERLQHEADEGIIGPTTTPASGSPASRVTPLPVSLSTSGKRRNEAQFVAHPSSPLHASARSSSSTPRRTLHSGSVTPEDRADEEMVATASRGSSLRHHASSKRHSKKFSESSGKSNGRPKKMSWAERMRKSRYNPRMVLKNSGSVARDHLASERTFLAYVRTSMGLASMGVALVQLFAIADITSHALGTDIPSASPDMQRFARPLGALTIAFSFVVLLVGLWRYFKIQFSLPGGYFPIARISVIFTSFVFSAIVVTIFGAILSGRANA